MSGLKSFIPRSVRSDNLAKMIGLGASSQRQHISAAEACRRDYDSLGQLARLYKPGNATTESLAEDLDIALRTPIPDDNQGVFGKVEAHTLASSESGYSDVSSDDREHHGSMDDAHYDSLQKRSPAIMNPSYFDAVRISPSQGFGFGSARYIESSGSINNLSMDFFGIDGGSLEDSPRQIGGFEFSGLEDSFRRGADCLSFGGRRYDRTDAPVQVLDIPMPDQDVLEDLASAPPREGKASPFRSYYGHEPNLTDIEEETEPEHNSSSRVLPTPVKNRHENRSRSQSIAKMQSSPFASSSSAWDGGSKTSSRRHSHTTESPLSRRSKRSFRDSRGQRSSGGVSGDTFAPGFSAAGGSLANIEEEKEDDDADTGALEAFFVSMKDPIPVVTSTSSPIASAEVPLPFDFTNSTLQPFPITPEEETSLLDEPRFVKDGVIPSEYIRFATPQADATPTRQIQPNRPTYPVRGSSLHATPRRSPMGAIIVQSPVVDDGSGLKQNGVELVDIFRKISKDFAGTDIGKIANAYLLCPEPRDIEQAIATTFNHDLRANQVPSADLLASASVAYKVVGRIKKQYEQCASSGIGKNALELYVDVGGGAFVQKELDAVTATVAKNLSEPYTDGAGGVGSSVTGATAEDAGKTGAATESDPFTDGPAATANGQSGINRSQSAGTTATAAWAQDITATLDGVAIAPFGFSALAATLGMPPPTLRGKIRDTQVGSVVRYTQIGSITPGTAPGTASRYPLEFVYVPFDGRFAGIDEVVSGSGARSVHSYDSQATDSDSSDDVVEGSVAQRAATLAAHAHSGSNRASTTPSRASAQYSLFPPGAATPRSPTQAVEASRKPSVNKPLPAVGTSAASAPNDGSQGFLSLNKPLPAISQGNKANSPAHLPDVSPGFPGIPGIQRTPAERKQIGSMRKFGSDMKRRLQKLWTKSDEELAVNQANDRLKRAKSANRLKSLARDMDESLFKFPQPAASAHPLYDAEIQMARARRTSGVGLEESTSHLREDQDAALGTVSVSEQNASPRPLSDAESPRKRRITGVNIQESTRRLHEIREVALRSVSASEQNAGPSTVAENQESRARGVSNPMAAVFESAENVAARTPIPKKGARTAIVAAMGFGGRRKSIGENTRVNGA